MMFYAPKRLHAQEADILTSQIDIAPTVLGLLGLEYEAPFFGANVLACGGCERIALFSHNHDVAACRDFPRSIARRPGCQRVRSPGYLQRTFIQGTAMTVRFDHTVVWCRDKWRSAEFLAQMLGREPPVTCGSYQVVHLDNGVSLDFAEKAREIIPQHYAFRVSEQDFDAVLARLKQGGATFWADVARKHGDEIDHRDGGRGMCFEDPDGHLLEVTTRHEGR